ncbi:hypothetical protein FRB95_009395 [Tulasnella sp. JGI-2019a]|nr:hypothetical protein FRB95_009395 [Tulasnella sp. JGI-2019a]
MSSLTRSALADHNKLHSKPQRPSKIQLPFIPNPAAPTPSGSNSSRASNRSPAPSPPTVKSSYFPLTPATSVILDPSSSTRKPKLTPWQSHAHAFGTSAAQARFNPLPTLPPPVPGSSQTLSTIAESSTSPTSSTRQQEQQKQSHPKQQPPLKHYQKREGSTSVSPSHSHSNWTPGSQPTPIFDPDYPNGSPECLSPRIVSKTPDRRSSPTTAVGVDYFSVKPRHHHRRRREAPPPPKDATDVNRNKDGDTKPKEDDPIPLTICELNPVHPYIGTVEDVFGEWFPRPMDERTSQQLWLEMENAKADKVKEKRKKGSLDLSRREHGTRTATTMSNSSTVGSRSGYSSTQPSSIGEDPRFRAPSPASDLKAACKNAPCD